MRTILLAIAALVVGIPSAAGAQQAVPDTTIVYKQVGGAKLALEVFLPEGHAPGDRRSAIVFFFGGGWNGGSPSQFYEHARHFASRGMVAISAAYRTKGSHGTSPFESVQDGKSAIRWVRAHAAELGIDPARIAGSGGSAGGHVAAATAMLKGLDEPGEAQGASSRPDALVLFNPVIDNGPGGYGHERIGARYREFSPMHNIDASAPPTIVFLGTRDDLIPVATGKKFQKAMRDAGVRSELVLYEGQKHGFFNYRVGANEYYDRTLQEADSFLVSLGYLPAAPARSRSAADVPISNRPPNFVIIVADDLGYGDISPFDGWIRTPALDRLAREGLRFTDFHSNGPVCTPTRAALVTGRYQQRAGLESVLYAAPSHPTGSRGHGLSTRELTFADALGAAGYATGMAGKWHLGYEPRYNPVRNGFERYRGFVSGNVDYFSHVDGAGFYDWWDGDRLIQEPGYATHLITRSAVGFIEANRDRPFVLYVAHGAPHYPYQDATGRAFRVVGGGAQHYQPQPAPKDSAAVREVYGRMVQEMDRGIGEVVQTLQRLGLADNTLVFFTSDNGALPYGSSGPFRGFKGSLWEGGHRVPAIAWWPGKIRPGSTSQLAAGFDLMPTMLALAGAKAPVGHRMDGADLGPVLAGGTLPERMLVWQYEGQAAVRVGDWKLLVDEKKRTAPSLFNLAVDPGERVDLAARHPDRVRRMVAALNSWRQDVARGATTQPSI